MLISLGYLFLNFIVATQLLQVKLEAKNIIDVLHSITSLNLKSTNLIEES